MSLKKIGDQSFMGIGVPSITQRISFTQAYMEHAHGATLGWWNHTKEDGLDKCDPAVLVEDTKASIQVIYDLATVELLPYDFTEKLGQFRSKAEKLAEKYGEHLDFTDLLENLKQAEDAVCKVQARKEDCRGEKAQLYNDFLKEVSRQITNVTMTYADKYSQDSYGYTKLSALIPLFADLSRLVELDRDSLEYGLVKTQMVKNKNRINDALYWIIYLAQLTYAQI